MTSPSRRASWIFQWASRFDQARSAGGSEGGAPRPQQHLHSRRLRVERSRDRSEKRSMRKYWRFYPSDTMAVLLNELKVIFIVSFSFCIESTTCDLLLNLKISSVCVHFHFIFNVYCFRFYFLVTFAFHEKSSRCCKSKKPIKSRFLEHV